MKNKVANKLGRYALLLEVVKSLEDEIGLDKFTPLERGIIAVLSLDRYREGARVSDIITSDLLDHPTPSSFYRALKKLRDAKVVTLAGNLKTGSYRIASNSN